MTAPSSPGPVTPAYLATRQWRLGRHRDVHVYAMLGGQPSDDDPYVGTFTDPAYARTAVADHNATLPDAVHQPRTDTAAPIYCRACTRGQQAVWWPCDYAVTDPWTPSRRTWLTRLWGRT